MLRVEKWRTAVVGSVEPVRVISTILADQKKTRRPLQAPRVSGSGSLEALLQRFHLDDLVAFGVMGVDGTRQTGIEGVDRPNDLEWCIRIGDRIAHQ